MLTGSAGSMAITRAQDLQRLMLENEISRRLAATLYRKGALVDVIAELGELVV